MVVIGTGWLGNGLLQAFSHPENNVLGVYRTQAPMHPNVHCLSYQSEHFETIHRAIQQADWIIINFPPARNIPTQHAENCKHYLQFIGTQTKVLFVSSTSVYADAEVDYNEADQLSTSTATNANLLAEYAIQCQLGNRLTVVRMGGLVGNQRYPIKAMIASGKTYNGNEPVNLVHFQDAVGFIHYLVSNNICGETFNCVAPGHPLKKDYYQWLAKQMNCPTPIFSDGSNGKTINTKKSAAFGYTFRYPDPFLFPID